MTDGNNKLARRLVLASMAITRQMRAAPGAHQLTPAQRSTLSMIAFSGRIKPSRLAQLEKVSRPTIARTISQLVSQDLVIKVENPDDARSVYVQSTPKGLEALQNSREQEISPLAVALAGINSVERRTLERALGILEQLDGIGEPNLD